MNRFGSSGKIILFDGTSSSGKTTISNYLKKDGYHHISFDDFAREGFIKFMTEIPNEYTSRAKREELRKLTQRKVMYEESLKHEKVVFDDISQIILNFIPKEEIYIIVVYASPTALIRNILSRRATDPRGPSILMDQFAKRYVKTNDPGKSIDIINRNKLIEDLRSIKFEFESDEELIKYAHDVFSKMNIFDGDDHPITLREEYYYDYILNSSNNNLDLLFEELKTIIN